MAQQSQDEKKAAEESFCATYLMGASRGRTRRKFKQSDKVSDLKQCIQNEQGGDAKPELMYNGKKLMDDVCALFCLNS